MWGKRIRAAAMIAAAAAAAAIALPAVAKTASTADRTSAATLARNKQVVLGMWHDVIDGRNIANAPRYIAEDYVQHSPSAGQGRAALMTFLKKEFGDPAPRAAGTYPLTKFVFVLAEGDLVQLMFQRQIPRKADPAIIDNVWWYDTYRVQDGLIVEHWDSATE